MGVVLMLLRSLHESLEAPQDNDEIGQEISFLVIALSIAQFLTRQLNAHKLRRRDIADDFIREIIDKDYIASNPLYQREYYVGLEYNIRFKKFNRFLLEIRSTPGTLLDGRVVFDINYDKSLPHEWYADLIDSPDFG